LDVVTVLGDGNALGVGNSTPVPVQRVIAKSIDAVRGKMLLPDMVEGGAYSTAGKEQTYDPPNSVWFQFHTRPTVYVPVMPGVKVVLTPSNALKDPATALPGRDGADMMYHSKLYASMAES
jgi:hypothetical protein